MKVLSLLALGFATVHAAVTAEEVLNITAGILIGFSNEENLDYLSACVSDTGRIGYDLYGAVEEFIVGDFDSVRQGLYLVGDALITLSDDLFQCQ